MAVSLGRCSIAVQCCDLTSCWIQYAGALVVPKASSILPEARRLPSSFYHTNHIVSRRLGNSRATALKEHRGGLAAYILTLTGWSTSLEPAKENGSMRP